MRYALVLALVLGMAPGLGELAESVAHLIVAGHVAHTDAGHGDFDDQGSEHGCGTTQHRCGCCASQAVTVEPRAPDSMAVPEAGDRAALDVTVASLHDPAPPQRPPIAS